MDDTHHLKTSIANEFSDLKNRLSYIKKQLNKANNKITDINNAIKIFEEWFNEAEQTVKSMYPKQVTDSEFSTVKEQCNVSQNTMHPYYVHTITPYTVVWEKFSMKNFHQRLGTTKIKHMKIFLPQINKEVYNGL